jgi:gluconate kinase
MAFDDTQIKQANEELETRLANDRIEWKNKINDLVHKIKNMNDLAECQVNMLSYRQILLDKVTDFKTMIYKRNATWERYYRNQYREYTLNYDVKLTSGEKHQFIKADLSALRTQIDMLQSHVDYYYECIKTLDNMAFAIRNRIRLDDEQQ